jgi:hypothetical protein
LTEPPAAEAATALTELAAEAAAALTELAAEAAAALTELAAAKAAAAAEAHLCVGGTCIPKSERRCQDPGQP